MNCYVCHGRRGGGRRGPSPRGADRVSGSSDTALFQQVKNGQGAIPPYKEHLSDTGIWKVLVYVRTEYQGPEEDVN